MNVFTSVHCMTQEAKPLCNASCSLTQKYPSYKHSMFEANLPSANPLPGV